MAVYCKKTNKYGDKENFTEQFSYNWNQKKKTMQRFDLFNVEFVRNLNPNNYLMYAVHHYDALNTIGKTYNENTTYCLF
jgi:DUF2075 family protein